MCFNKRNGNTKDREEYFDQDLYDQRYAVERTNAWMDSFRSLLNRFDTTVESWKGFNFGVLCHSTKKTKKEKSKSLNQFKVSNILNHWNNTKKSAHKPELCFNFK